MADTTIPKYNYIPTYIKRKIANKPKDVVTAAYWNELFNLLITQGDYTAEELGNILSHLSTEIEGLADDVAHAITEEREYASAFVIHLFRNVNPVTADKSFAEIRQAIVDGREILLWVSDVQCLKPVCRIFENELTLTVFDNGIQGYGLCAHLYECYADNHWSVNEGIELASITDTGLLKQLTTTNKTSLVNAINEIKQATDTKQDKLIAGENITIAEDGKTISAAGGVSNAIEYFEVTLTAQDGVLAADKTFEQVKAAVADGKPVLKVHSDGDVLWFFLLDKSSAEIDFVGFADEQILAYLTAKQNGSWETTVTARVTVEMLSELSDKLGNLGNLTTADKSNLVAVINEVKGIADNKQAKLIAGENITIAEDGRTISATGGDLGNVKVPTKTSELENDSGFVAASELAAELANKQDIISDLATIRSGAAKGATALQSVPSSYRTAAAQDVIDSGKVDKVSGKGLSTNDYTDTAKAKVDAIPANPQYTDTVFSGSYNDLTDKPTIPAPVTEQTVSGWGFTKNTGTYSKPTDGIPKSDLANDVQASLGKAETALQEHQSLAAYRTAAAQDNIDITKQDKLIAGENITIAEDGKTISATGGGVLPVTLTLGTPIQQSNRIGWYYTADQGRYEIKDAIDAGITVLKCSLIYEDSPNEVAKVIYLNFSSMDDTAIFVGFDLPDKCFELRFPITSSIEGMLSYITLPTTTSQLENDSGFLTLDTLPKYEGVVE